VKRKREGIASATENLGVGDEEVEKKRRERREEGKVGDSADAHPKLTELGQAVPAVHGGEGGEAASLPAAERESQGLERVLLAAAAP